VQGVSIMFGIYFKVFEKNRYLRAGGLLTALAVFLFAPSFTNASSNDNFESYPTGDVDSVTSSWSDGSGSWNIVSSPVFEGSRSLACSSSSCGTPTTTASDLQSFSRIIQTGYIYNDGRQQSIRLYDTNGNSMLRVEFDNDGDHIFAENDTTTETTSNSYATSTWVYFQIDIDFTNSLFRVNIDDGPFTPWIDFFTTSNGIPSYWSFNSFTSTGGTVFAFDNWGTDATTLSDIPPSDENYIVILSPTFNTSYTTNIIGELNIPSPTSSTSTYVISFVSQTGIDYSSQQITGTTTSQTQTRFNETVSFQQDDVVYVKAYLYDSSTANAIYLVDVSPEYEWWVSANANPTEQIDLGAFRTGTTTFCGESAGALDFAWGTCMAMRLLFVPNESSLNYITDQLSEATSTIPFSYMYDSVEYLDTIFSATSSDFTIAAPSSTSTTFFSSMNIINTSSIRNDTMYQVYRSFATAIIYIAIPFYAFRRIRSYFTSSSSLANQSAT
jgi:hypothetical protein